MVWAVSLQQVLMSCNLEQQEAMPAEGNCCCLVHSFTNGGGGNHILGAHFLRTKEAEGDGVRNSLLGDPELPLTWVCRTGR